jgi:hypothetical protein
MSGRQKADIITGALLGIGAGIVTTLRGGIAASAKPFAAGGGLIRIVNDFRMPFGTG